MVFASVSSNQRGSLRLTAMLPSEIDDWTLLGRCTKYSLRPLSAGGAVNAGCGTSPFVQAPNAFSAAATPAPGAAPRAPRRRAAGGQREGVLRPVMVAVERGRLRPIHPAQRLLGFRGAGVGMAAEQGG